MTKNTNASELESCPFCGERGDLQTRSGQYAGYYVACHTEDCMGNLARRWLLHSQSSDKGSKMTDNQKQTAERIVFSKYQIWANPDDEIMMVTEVHSTERGLLIEYVTEHGDKGSFWDSDHEIVQNIRQINTDPRADLSRPVDLEALKRGKTAEHDGIYVTERSEGWNECLDYLSTQGHLSPKPQSEFDSSIISEWPRVTSRWEGEALIWTIEGKEISDRAFRSWVFHNMEHNHDKYIDVIRHNHCVAYAKSLSAAKPDALESLSVLRLYMPALYGDDLKNMDDHYKIVEAALINSVTEIPK